jgi:hypothetical protein
MRESSQFCTLNIKKAFQIASGRTTVGTVEIVILYGLRSRNSKNRQYNGQKGKRTKGQTTIYKTLHKCTMYMWIGGYRLYLCF